MVTDHPLDWGGKSLSDLVGKSVYFRIRLADASVYTVGGNIEPLTGMDIVPVEE